MTNNLTSIFSREQVTTLLKNLITRKKIKNGLLRQENKVKQESSPSMRVPSPYGKMLRESKKLCLFYGNLSKKSLKKVFNESKKQPSKVSDNVFSILESRLDVVLYRSAFFDSILTAKQMVRAGKIEVNKKKVISPGYNVIAGDIVSVITSSSKDKNKTKFSEKNTLFENNTNQHQNNQFDLQSRNFRFIDTFYNNKKTLLIESHSNVDQNRANSVNTRKGSADFSDCKIKHFKEDIALRRQSPSVMACKELRSIENNKKIVRQKQSQWRFKTSPDLLSLIRDSKKNTLINLIKKSFAFPLLNDKRSLKETSFANDISRKNVDVDLDNFSLISLFNKKLIRKDLPDFSFSSLRQNNLKNLKDPLRNCYKSYDITKINQDNFIIINYLLYLKKQLTTLLNQNLIVVGTGLRSKVNPTSSPSFLKSESFKDNTLVKEKPQQKKSPTGIFQHKVAFYQNKKKALHLEISYQSRTIIFLFPPQRIDFPQFINLSLIYK